MLSDHLHIAILYCIGLAIHGIIHNPNSLLVFCLNTELPATIFSWKLLFEPIQSRKFLTAFMWLCYIRSCDLECVFERVVGIFLSFVRDVCRVASVENMKCSSVQVEVWLTLC